jgi:HAD superfamily hydrolase (TIGR01509 family)
MNPVLNRSLLTRKTMIRWIVFDVMGVVFTVGDDTDDLLVPFVQARNRSISREKINEIYLRTSLGQITSRQFWQEVGLGSQYPAIETVYLDSQLVLDEGFLRVARAMSKRYALGLLSNDIGEWSAYLRNKFGMDFIDVAIISGDVHCRKPAPAIFERFLKAADARAEECIFIDDRGANLSAARSLGLRTIHFARQQDDTVFVPDARIASFDELEQAVAYICRHTDAPDGYSALVP